MDRNTLAVLALAFPFSNVALPLAHSQDDCTAVWDGTPSTTFANDLIVFDDGTGPHLYLGGSFLRQWNGETWDLVGAAPSGSIWRLRIVNTSAGAKLWSIGRGVYQYNGSTTMQRIGTGSFVATDLVQGDIGEGEQKFLACSDSVRRLDGESWTTIGAHTYHGCFNSAAAIYDDGTGASLYVGGSFTTIEGQAAQRIARYQAGAWQAVGSGVDGGGVWPCGTGAIILSICVFDDGSGPKLYVGGTFTTAGGVPAGGIACWDGVNWSAVGGATEPENVVMDLSILDFGGGPRLVALGSFSRIGGVAARNIATWDGSTWAQLGPGIGTNRENAAYCAAMYDDGSADGPSLFVGGDFENVDGAAIYGVARLDCVCPDLSGDGAVGLDDLAIVLASFGQTGSSDGDLNHDEFVSIADLSLLLARFGTNCE